MRILAFWPECDFFHNKQNREPITSFWVRVDPDELDKVITYINDPDSFREEIQYGRREQDPFYVLVSKDLSSIVTMRNFYPVSNLWNGNSPFITIGPLEINTLEDIVSVDDNSLEPANDWDLSHYYA